MLHNPVIIAVIVIFMLVLVICIGVVFYASGTMAKYDEIIKTKDE